LRDPEYIGNYSRIYAPMFTKLNQFVTENRQPNVTLCKARSSINSLPAYDHGMRYYDVARRRKFQSSRCLVNLDLLYLNSSLLKTLLIYLALLLSCFRCVQLCLPICVDFWSKASQSS